MINFSTLPIKLGDYELIELILEQNNTRTFLALQTLVHRYVLLTLLSHDEEGLQEDIDGFLASLRAKALVKEAYTCSVYEAVQADTYTFYTQELPPGKTLDKMILEGDKIMPENLCELLIQIVDIQLRYKKMGYNIAPWTPQSVFIAESGEVHCLNLIESGQRIDNLFNRDRVAIGHAILDVIAINVSGTTRLQTLAQWLIDESAAPKGLSWQMTKELVQTVIHQLEESEHKHTGVRSKALVAKYPNKGMRKWYYAIGGLALLLLVALVASHKPVKPVVSNVVEEKSFSIDSLRHRSDVMISIYDAVKNTPKKLSVDVHEVTIDSYERFLRFLDQLSPMEKKSFLPKGIPVSKDDFTPKNWSSILAAAKSNSIWNNKFYSLRTPVTGVDYWDALAYAKWENRRLIKQEEWHALVNPDNPKPVAEFCSRVDDYKADMIAPGIAGIAGGVAEWTGSQAVDPAFPMGGRKYVICGGSFKNNGSYTTEEFLDSGNDMREDLGFRTVKDID